MVRNKYQDSHATSLKKLESLVEKCNDIQTALKGREGEATPAPSSTTTTTPPSSRARTVATPDYEGESIPVFGSDVDLAQVSMNDFTASTQFCGCISIPHIFSHLLSSFCLSNCND